MTCTCSEMPNTVKGSSSDLPFKRMIEIDHKADKWINLLKCEICGQHWQVDGWDKYQTCLALKISDPVSWQSFDDLQLRKTYLVNSRGGFSQEVCSWVGCQERCLKGLAFCVMHAYDIGLRE